MQFDRPVAHLAQMIEFTELCFNILDGTGSRPRERLDLVFSKFQHGRKPGMAAPGLAVNDKGCRGAYHGDKGAEERGKGKMALYGGAKGLTPARSFGVGCEAGQDRKPLFEPVLFEPAPSGLVLSGLAGAVLFFVVFCRVPPMEGGVCRTGQIIPAGPVPKGIHVTHLT